MEQNDLARLRALIHQESGIAMGPDKELLLENRIRKRLKALRLQGVAEYLEVIESDLEKRELIELIDAVSTNHTFFFREGIHFEFLAQLLRQWQAQGIDVIRGWSAASSSGEEPYSIAITALENLDFRRTDFRLLATDICTRVLNSALRACYRREQLREMSEEVLQRYFDPISLSGEELYHVREEVRTRVLFKRLNLSQQPFPVKGPLDFIFCRNVMIYFDTELRTRLVNSFYELLKPGGYLFVGHSESLTSLAHKFQLVRNAIYRKPEDRR